MSDFLAKPLDPPLLYQKLHAWLAGAPPGDRAASASEGGAGGAALPERRRAS